MHTFLDVKYTDTLSTQQYNPATLSVNYPGLPPGVVIPNTNPFFLAPPNNPTATSETVRSKLTQVMTIEEETWNGNALQFRVRALGQPANGTIDIAEDHARLEVTLPWPLAQIAEKVQRAIQSQGTAMLEKK